MFSYRNNRTGIPVSWHINSYCRSVHTCRKYLLLSTVILCLLCMGCSACSDRLSAPDILSIKKVMEYIYQRLYGEEGKLDEDKHKIDCGDCLEILCMNQVCCYHSISPLHNSQMGQTLISCWCISPTFLSLIYWL